MKFLIKDKEVAMTKMIFAFLLVVWSIAFVHAENLKTVPTVDVPKYMGAWYQIAGNPMPFNKDCLCSRQVLNLESSGDVSVYNSCNAKSLDGPLLEIAGTAKVVDTQTNAKLEVDFGMPTKGEYWVIGLDKDYRWAVVADPTKNSLYILARTPTIDQVMYKEAYDLAASKVDTANLKPMAQMDCTYPEL